MSPGLRNSPAHTPSNSPMISVSMEECSLEIVGHGSIKSVSRRNSTVVVFVDSPDKADLHVVSFRGQVSIVLKNKEELNLAFPFSVEEFDSTLYFTTDSLKCFGCVEEGLVIQLCPNSAGGSLDSRSARDAALRATQVISCTRTNTELQNHTRSNCRHKHGGASEGSSRAAGGATWRSVKRTGGADGHKSGQCPPRYSGQFHGRERPISVCQKEKYRNRDNV